MKNAEIYILAISQGGINLEKRKNLMEDFIKRGKSEKVHAKTGKNFQRRGGGYFWLARIYSPAQN